MKTQINGQAISLDPGDRLDITYWADGEMFTLHLQATEHPWRLFALVTDRTIDDPSDGPEYFIDRKGIRKSPML